MKNAAKLLALLGAAIAVVWAMRDRLVSIAAPKEPEPPRFRVIPPAEQSGSSTDAADDLTAIDGIGPVYASRLRDAGITSFADLVDAGADRVTEVTGAATSRVDDWLSQASART